MKLYHGARNPTAIVRKGAWVTADPAVAAHFALDRAQPNNDPHVHELHVADQDVDWDVLARVAGVDDDRGTLLRDVRPTIARRVTALDCPKDHR